MTGIDSCIENEKAAHIATKRFDTEIRKMYKNWWIEKLSSVENRKLAFFSQYKKTLKFEQYLDIKPRHVRKYTTQLRTSSHAFPIENLRYTKPKTEAHERKCNICVEMRIT